MDSGIDILNLNWNNYTNCSADNSLLEKPCATIRTRGDHFESDWATV